MSDKSRPPEPHAPRLINTSPRPIPAEMRAGLEKLLAGDTSGPVRSSAKGTESAETREESGGRKEGKRRAAA